MLVAGGDEGSGGRRDDEVGERACQSVKRRTWELAESLGVGRWGLGTRVPGPAF